MTQAAARDGNAVLEIKDLRTHFFLRDGTVKAVDGVTFEIADGRTLGVVGESGCGKSITAMSVLRLIGRPGRIVNGQVLLHGKDLVQLSDAEMRDIRGNQISMIFQEPMTSLNPVYTCGDQIAEAVQQHSNASRREAWDRGIEMLRLVGIPDAKRRASEYPHQLSGGMRQRVGLARALAVDADILLMDEPFASVDAQTRSDLEDLVSRVHRDLGMTILFVTHDIDEAVYLGERVIVLSASPTVVQEQLKVDLPGERDQVHTRVAPRFAELRTHVYEQIQAAKQRTPRR